MGWYIEITQGSVTRHEHQGQIKLETIYSVVESPFDIAMSIETKKGRGRRCIDWLMNDEGLFKYEGTRKEHNDPERWGRERKPHRWAMTIIRPTDGSPIVGPLMVCACNARGVHVPLTDAEADQIVGALSSIGFRVNVA